MHACLMQRMLAIRGLLSSSMHLGSCMMRERTRAHSSCSNASMQENRDIKKEEAKAGKMAAKGKTLTKKPAGKKQSGAVLKKPSAQVVPCMRHACMLRRGQCHADAAATCL